MDIIFALLSSIFASLTAILIKIGLAGINSNLATAIRTIIILIMSWVIVFYTNSVNSINTIETIKKSQYKDYYIYSIIRNSDWFIMAFLFQGFTDWKRKQGNSYR